MNINSKDIQRMNETKSMVSEPLNSSLYSRTDELNTILLKLSYIKNVISLIVLMVCILGEGRPVRAQSWQWARQNSAGIISDDPRVATSVSGYIYMAGVYASNIISFGGYTLVNPSTGYSVYFVKYDSSGTVLWMKGMGGGLGAPIGVSSIATDSTGNIYISGFTSDTTITFGTITMHKSMASTQVGMFLVKYDAAGNAIWAKKADGRGASSEATLAIDRDNNIYLAGIAFDSMIVFGSVSATSSYSYNGYLAKFDSSGTIQWAKIFGTNADWPFLATVATDDSGNVVIGGATTGNVFHFDTLTLLIPGSSSSGHVFFAKYGPNGGLIWTKGIGGDGYDNVWTIKIDARGNHYAILTSTSTALTIDAIPIAHPEWLLLKLNTAGHLVWFNTGAADWPFGPTSMSIDVVHNNVCMAGTFQGRFVLDSDSTDLVHWNHLILLKCDTSGNIRWMKTAGTTNDAVSYSMALDKSGGLYVAGDFGGPEFIFGSDILYNPNPDTEQSVIFLAKLDTAYTLVIMPDKGMPNAVRITPNPSDGLFTITLPAIQHGGAIRIIDPLGKEIKTRKFGRQKEPQQEFDLRSCNPGMYLVEINIDGCYFTKKLILR